MEISIYTIAIESLAPMLRALSAILDKAAQHAKKHDSDPAMLVNARLAPDMYPLANQAQLACNHARDAVATLVGKEPPAFENDEQTLNELKDRISKTIKYLESVHADSFAGTENREIKFPIPNAGSMQMNGFQYLRDWSLPHFYFHLVTAYDILRQNGVEIGKRDYLSRVGVYVRLPA